MFGSHLQAPVNPTVAFSLVTLYAIQAAGGLDSIPECLLHLCVHTHARKNCSKPIRFWSRYGDYIKSAVTGDTERRGGVNRYPHYNTHNLYLTPCSKSHRDSLPVHSLQMCICFVCLGDLSGIHSVYWAARTKSNLPWHNVISHSDCVDLCTRRCRCRDREVFISHSITGRKNAFIVNWIVSHKMLTLYHPNIWEAFSKHWILWLE